MNVNELILRLQELQKIGKGNNDVFISTSEAEVTSKIPANMRCTSEYSLIERADAGFDYEDGMIILTPGDERREVGCA